MNSTPASPSLSEQDLEALEALLDSLPANRDPLDVVMIDGYLCGVLLQPRIVPEARWLAHVVDIDGRPAPPNFPMDKLAALLRRRHAELNRAIAMRQWFDPWVYEMEDTASPSDTVLPWVAGFSTAQEAFPELMRQFEDDLIDPLATLYRFFDPEDLEDADVLLAEIETLEPPRDLPEAVEDLVRSVLLIADVSRPQTKPGPRNGGGGGQRQINRTSGGRGRPGPGPRSRNGRHA